MVDGCFSAFAPPSQQSIPATMRPGSPAPTIGPGARLLPRAREAIRYSLIMAMLQVDFTKIFAVAPPFERDTVGRETRTQA
jgi:hypothetical protein